MGIGIGAIVGAIVSFLGRLITEGVVKWVAMRAFFYSLFVFVLPIILYNLFGKIVSELGSYALSHVGSQSSIVIQLSGLAAYLAARLRLPEALSLVLSALSLRAALNFIPFVK